MLVFEELANGNRPMCVGNERYVRPEKWLFELADSAGLEIDYHDEKIFDSLKIHFAVFHRIDVANFKLHCEDKLPHFGQEIAQFDEEHNDRQHAEADLQSTSSKCERDTAALNAELF